MIGSINISDFIIPAVLVLAGLIAGIAVERVLVAALRRAAVRTKWAGEEVLIHSLHGIVVVGFVLGGCYLAVLAAPSGVRTSLPLDIIQSALIVLATVALARVSAGFVGLYASGIPGIEPSTSIFTHIIRAIVYVLGILVLLQGLGISITPMLTALGVGGLGVALALQGTLSNLFAGVQLIASRQIRVGEYIQLESGQEGYVADITWGNTTIRSLPNNMIIVPNSNLASAIITNFNQPEQQMNVNVQVGVAYDSDLQLVEAVTIEVAEAVMKEVTGSTSDFEPFIRYHTFGESSIDFSVIMQVKEVGDKYLIRHEFIKQLHQRFQREKIEIPFPIRTVHLEK